MRKSVIALVAVGVLSGSAAAATLTTTFVSDNQFAGAMFDLRALNAAGLVVDGWDTNLATSTGNPNATIQVWWRTGTFVGNHLSSAGWNLLGEANVVTAGTDNPTAVALAGLSLPFNQVIGVYFHVKDWTANPPPNGAPALRYSNLPPASSIYSNADLEFTGGIGRGNAVGGDPFAAAVFGVPGSTTNGRIWNGNVHYTAVPEPATIAVIGLGLAALAARRRRK